MNKVPDAAPYKVSENVIVQPPLSRKGAGPGLILLVDNDLPLVNSDRTLDPPPLQKWAEEGYAVSQVKLAKHDVPTKDMASAIVALQNLATCDWAVGCGLGLVCYLTEPCDALFKLLSELEVGKIFFKAVVSYGAPASGLKNVSQLVHHSPENVFPLPANQGDKIYEYVDKMHFAIPAHPNYSPASAALAHSRTLTYLKAHLGGPFFDLEALWEEHTKFEFGDRNVEATMSTMVQEPYVNHIPTMTGGVGRERLTQFYRHHFVFSNPDDTNLQLVSRTTGIDRVIDEFIFSFTHDRTIDWLVPAVPPTGRKVNLPMTSVVNFRGDRLYHEHIAWDQASLLRQLGLMPEYLPFPYPINGKMPAAGKRYEYMVPTAGDETAKKLLHESAVESNQMFQFSAREVDD